MAHKDFLISKRPDFCYGVIVTDDLVEELLRTGFIFRGTAEKLTHAIKTDMERSAELANFLMRKPESRFLQFLDIMDTCNHDFAPTLRTLWLHHVYGVSDIE